MSKRLSSPKCSILFAESGFFVVESSGFICRSKVFTRRITVFLCRIMVICRIMGFICRISGFICRIMGFICRITGFICRTMAWPWKDFIAGPITGDQGLYICATLRNISGNFNKSNEKNQCSFPNPNSLCFLASGFESFAGMRIFLWSSWSHAGSGGGCRKCLSG